MGARENIEVMDREVRANLMAENMMRATKSTKYHAAIKRELSDEIKEKRSK